MADGSFSSGDSLAQFANGPRRKFGTILADPPWRFTNRTGKVAHLSTDDSLRDTKR